MAMHDDVYQMYLDEIAAICPMDAAEEEQLIQKLKSGDTTVGGISAIHC